ncbi:MAG TPA: PQQ-dependent sugar dehydrogenase [Candidatus Limnocylindrales bacterium]|nr:PQQ-dependent sugar dehydrogenase [Candidatus Limnocylindrales bacterium]
MKRLRTSTRTFVSRFLISGALGIAVIGAGAWIFHPWDPVRADVIQSGLDHPWDIAFTDDGHMLVTERIGRVRVYAGGEPDAELLHTATIPDVRAELESGLMGIAIHDDAVFVCASRDAGGDWKVELLRSTLAGDGSLAPFEVVPVGEMTGAARHQGCAVQVDATEHLWLSVGDANLPAGENAAQDPDRLNGKVLRLALDGSVPDDNPFGNAVYSLGHRNPQGLAFAPDGTVWEAEHGTDENDEVNLLRRGGNYGYPCFTGADAPGPIPEGCGPASDYLAPAWASGSPTLATSGATFLIGSEWGDWEGDLIVSTLKEEDLRRFSVASGGGLTLEETLLDDRFGRLRAVVIGSDGALYVSTTNGGDDRIVRVTR